jgi:intraflagellar transport protein 88
MTGARIGTGAVGPNGEPLAARPMTSVRGAGFRKDAPETDAVEMDANGQQKEAAALEKMEPSPDDILRKLEADVNAKIGESAMLAERRKWTEAVAAAESAKTLERQFSKKKEEENPDAVNFELSYAVHLNLAAIQHRADMLNEALHNYNQILKNKLFPQSGRVRVNIGNIHFAQKKYLLAIKMYRMAYDMLPHTQQKMRNKILKNIGHAFVLMGQYADAISSYEHVLDQRPIKEIGGQERKVPGTDFQTAFNVLLCYLAMGDQDKMKRGFGTILQQRLPASEDDERYLNLHDDEKVQLVLDVIKVDAIAKRETSQKTQANKFIIASAKLIAPAIDTNFAAGYVHPALVFSFLCAIMF